MASLANEAGEEGKKRALSLFANVIEAASKLRLAKLRLRCGKGSEQKHHRSRSQNNMGE